MDEEFSDFYRKTIRGLTSFLVNHGASLPDAAHIAQDTMVTAYRHWSELDALADRRRVWAYRVASRALVRRRAAIEEEPVGEVPDPESLSMLAGSDELAEWERRQDVLVLLRSLPPRQRQVLAWVLAGFTPAEIAQQLDLPTESVHSNLRKARRSMNSDLKTSKEEQ